MPKPADARQTRVSAGNEMLAIVATIATTISISSSVTPELAVRSFASSISS